MVASNMKAAREAVMKLSQAERLALAEELYLSADASTQEAVHVAWEAEMNRRLDALDRGEATLLDGEPIMKALKEGRIP